MTPIGKASEKKRDDVLRRMLNTPPDPRKSKKEIQKQGGAGRHSSAGCHRKAITVGQLLEEVNDERHRI